MGKMARVGKILCSFLLSDLETTHLVRDLSKTRSFHYLFNLVNNEDTIVNRL